MIKLRFSMADLSRVRFSYSPLWEAVTSLRVLAAGGRGGLHGPWLARVAGRLDRVDLEVLTAVVRPSGYLPDFLHPLPSHPGSGFAADLAAVGAADPELVAAELTHLAAHPVTMPGPGRAERVALLGALAADPQAALARITTALDCYWRAAIAPDWPRIRSLLAGDVAFRSRELATGGVHRLFRTLHPAVSLEHDTLSIVKYYNGAADLGDRGLLLIPCVFAWPDVLVRTADPQPALTYAPRGLGRLWQPPSTAGATGLAGVLGHTRAAILTQLDLPMSTTHLAGQLDLTAPTVNAHLKALRLAGIVSTHRDGHSVLYLRTELGDHLLSGGEPS